MTKITNKTEAYNYLYDLFQGNVYKNDQLLSEAKAFFTKRELECLNLERDISLNSCFSYTAKKCGCVVK